MFKGVQKTVNSKIVMVFTTGFILGIIFCWVFLCCLKPCALPQDEECIPTCLLVHLRDQDGNPLHDTYIAVFDSDLNLICEGNTDAGGNFLCDRDVFGCGDEPIKLYAEGVHIGYGPWYAETWLNVGESGCQIESTYGCCEVTWTVNTGP